MLFVERVLIFLLLTAGICLAIDICEWQEDGTYLSHPADCSKFVLCLGGVTALIESCPIGFHFNRELGICDYSVRAGCEKNFNLLEFSSGSCCCCSSSNANSNCKPEPDTNCSTEAPPTEKPCTEPTTEPITEPTGKPCTEPTTEPTSQPTKGPTTEHTTEQITEVTSEPTTEPTTEQTTEPTTEQITEVTSEPTTEPTTEQITEVTSEPTTEQTTEQTTEETTEPTTEHTTEQTTEKTAEPTTEPTTEQTTEPTTEQTTEPSTEQTTEPTSQPTKEPTTEQSTEQTTQPTTEQTTEPTTELTSEQTTKPTTESTTQFTSEPTTEPTTKLTTEQSREPTTESSSETTPTTSPTTKPTTEPTIKPTTEPITESSSKSTPTPTTSTTTKSTSSNQNQNLPLCSNNLTYCYDVSGVQNILYPGNCRKYIVCIDGCATVMTCPSNLYYNLTYGFCDYQENVDCPYKEDEGALVGPSGRSCDDPGRCAGLPEGTMLRDPDSNGFIICQCECEIKRDCPTGLIYNEQVQVCDWPVKSVHTSKDCPSGETYNEITATCQPVSEHNSTVICDSMCANQTDGALLPVEGACNKFYACVNGCAYELQCPENLIFNTTDLLCDYPQYTTCSWPYTPDFGPTAGPSGIACEAGGRCVGQPEGILLASLSATDKYVVCQCECEVEMNCPKGLMFNTLLQICDFPATLLN